MDTVLSITTTVDSAEAARQLAQELIRRRLAACVQVDEGVSSHYRWEGRDCLDAEWRLTVKTLPSCRAAVEAFFAAEHPYQLPQLLWLEMQASPAYAAWVRAQVGEAA
ncbi:divalent-cation tolerance protein CutA [Ramlibacter rhizophilus]|uniref:Divalent-cation tolerance protein CutA n=1 Tax=Ramlibacter rhizophilus TaxID=1781167 RepID=A0A4Z0BRM7_9BURK|nr:divalent-cation tolerance protein CutA [Ramlibacter rhizophilus]TFZ01114.1 divalent-cation tolerance protein CutA [Ramlibacter rhizophilus]